VKIGIDFGTTRIVVAAADRGNYPLVNFESSDGNFEDYFPSVMAISEAGRVYGWQALEMQGKPGWTLIRSLKRYLKTAGPKSEIVVDNHRINIGQAITEMMSALRSELLQKSTLGKIGKKDKLQVMLGVPANANTNQRFLTEDAARNAGFEVLGLMNEPSAAALEFANINTSDRKIKPDSGLLVYDLGGGTFDVSILALGDTEHGVIASDGLPDMGGDDFDEILAFLALEHGARPKTDEESLTSAEWYLLFEECREKKEALSPNSRKLSIDLGQVRKDWEEISIGVDAFYAKCRPLIESSRDVVEAVLAANPEYPIDTLYLTGGGSELPPVARVLKETFGRRVRRSAYMRSATAIGLAIGAEGKEAKPLRDQFTRNFGVWREADAGNNVIFDVIFPRGIKLPAKGEVPLRSARSYHPAHNIGHFRYLECSKLGPDNQPEGEISNWEEIRVAFDPDLRGLKDLAQQPVRDYSNGQSLWVEEEYICDASGEVRVKIQERRTAQANEYRLSQVAGR
jgi:molecular chaperone DnaK (HSP70)